MLNRGTNRVATAVAIGVLFALTVWAASPEKRTEHNQTATSIESVDNTTYIDANKILMFVTNHGNIGRDLDGVFGNDYGTYYPYVSPDKIMDGTMADLTPFYAGGLWLGGVDSASGDTLVAISEYSSEYVPGTMVGGTYSPDHPSFQVYKLYADSLADNPNQDYLNWPVNQGAPYEITGDGDTLPLMQGEQMLWAVYNDANQYEHNNMQTQPLGVEVQQTVWAYDESGDIDIPPPSQLPVEHTAGSGDIEVEVMASDYYLLTGDDYQIVTDFDDVDYYHWDLIDVTLDDTVLTGQPMDGTAVSVDGLIISVKGKGVFESFEVVANGAGPLDPPEAGAAPWNSFPVPTEVDQDGYPTDNQQVGGGIWLIHTGDNGGTSGGGTRGSYTSFLERVLRVADDGGRRAHRLSGYDWEMRFTGSNDYPGMDGGYAWDGFNTGQSYWVPFELWRCPKGTPDDPSDDLRIIPWILGDVFGNGSGDNYTFDLSQYGSEYDGTCHDGCEHSVSGADDDPYTDWLYWRIPADDFGNEAIAGDSAYLVFENAMRTDPLNWVANEGSTPVMDRMVLVNWNGGVEPPFTQNLPEQGTIFRLVTAEPEPGDVFAFRAATGDWDVAGANGLTIYIKYKLINKGGRALRNFFASFWGDPDLGTSTDDYVGCDTLSNVFFAYNSASFDSKYGAKPPAVGLKLLEGPIVPSVGDVATVDGIERDDYKNLDMYSFSMYINGTDPDNAQEAYWYMLGLDAKNNGIPLMYNGQPTRYQLTGDPVTGTGWLDNTPGDRRMMASYGPFDFRPGDTQQVVLKFAVGQGDNSLSSITALREVLNYVRIPTGMEPTVTGTLPVTYSLGQNYPNPFNPSTTIRYALPEKAQVRIEVVNLLGQRVAILVNETLAAGEHSVVWNGTDNSGAQVASGIYFYRIVAGDYIASRKMMLLK